MSYFPLNLHVQSRVYRCEEAVQRGIAYCSKSTVASVPTAGTVQGDSVSQTQPLGATSLPPTKCDVNDPTLLADCDKKPPAEANQPGPTTHLANPEEAEERSELSSCSETPGPSDSALDDVPSRPEVCHTFRSVPVDSEGEYHSFESNNSMDSGGSSSESHKPTSPSTEGMGPLAEDVSPDCSSGSASTSYSGEEEQEEEELYIPKVGGGGNRLIYLVASC